MANLKEMMMKKKAQIASSSGGERTQALKAGRNVLRILPSWKKGSDVFFHDYGLHYVPMGDKKQAYLCEFKTFERNCPLCDAIREGIINATNDKDKAMFKDASASGRILVNAIDVEKDPNTPFILNLPPSVFDKIMDIVIENCDEESGSADFNIVTDLKRGVEIIINKTGAGLNTEYSVQPSLKAGKPISPEVMKKIKDLDAFVQSELESGRAKALPKFVTTAALPYPTAAKTEDSPFEMDDDVEYYEAPKEAPKPKAKAKVEETLPDDELESLLGEIM